jgi:hypothetical protein
MPTEDGYDDPQKAGENVTQNNGPQPAEDDALGPPGCVPSGSWGYLMVGSELKRG